MEILMHGYHRGLLGVVRSKKERIKGILAVKPVAQQELRLRLMQSISLKLLPRVLIRPAKALDRAQNEWETAWIKREKAWIEAHKPWPRSESTQGQPDSTVRATVDKKFNEWEKANRSFITMEKARDKARDNFLIVCRSVRPRLQALHEKLCVPDCPWDGERILPDS